MATDIGVSLVRIQDDLSKLRQAINRGTHNDGTPIDLNVIETVVERTQARIGKAIEKASRDKNSQVTTLPFLRPSRSLSPERIQLLLRESVSQSNNRAKYSAQSPRPPGKLEPIKRQDSEATILRTPTKKQIDTRPRKGKAAVSKSKSRLPSGKRRDSHRVSPRLDPQDIERGLLSLCERGLIPPGSKISLRNTPVRPKQARLHPSTDQHIRPTIADVDQSAGQLALVKLAPDPSPAAISLKINFAESANKNKDQNMILQYGTKRIGSSPPTKSVRNSPTDTKSRELVQTENFQLLYEFSSTSNKPIQQIESQLPFQRLRETYDQQWGDIVSLLRHFVALLMKSGANSAIINGHNLARLAFEFPLERLPSTADLMECVANKTQVLEQIGTVGSSYRVPGGLHRAATRIQAKWRMFVSRRRYQQARQLKWAAGVICMSWILRMRMVGIRKILADKRAGFVERSINRNIQLGRVWEDLRDSTHTIVHIPSLGCHASMRGGIRNLELRQSLQISRLFDLGSSSNSSSNILYISALECRDELLQYYFNIFAIRTGTTDTPRDRFQCLVPDHIADFEYNKLSLATILNHSPRTLRRIRHLTQGHPAYLVPDVPSIDDFAVADYLNIPILAATPAKLELFHNKSSCQRIVDSMGVGTPPHTSDIWTENALIEKLSDLIILNLDCHKWAFKMNYGIDGMGTAYCDTRELQCYEVLRRDRARYRHNWEQIWAHESSQSKLLIELPSYLMECVKLADRSLHGNQKEFFQNFFKCGGKIEAMPPVENFTALSVNLFIAPNGTINLLSSGDQILSSPFKLWGVSLPQTSIEPQELERVTQLITDTLLTHEIIGSVNFDLVTFFEGDTQRIWLTDIKLCPSNYMGLVNMLKVVGRGHFDTKSGHYLCDIDGNLVPKFCVVSNQLKHSNFSLIRYKVLFQMFKAQGIVFGTETKNGTLFGLIDDVSRRQIGMAVQSESLAEALKVTSHNLSVIHQEISTVAMPGRNNFEAAISQFITQLSDVTTGVGYNVEFLCRLDTTPEQDSLHQYIIWSVDGVKVESESTIGMYTIDSAPASMNNSIIQCAFFTELTSSAKLILIGQPDTPVLNIVTTSHSSVTIRIDVGNTGGAPVSEIRVSLPSRVWSYKLTPGKWSSFDYQISDLEGDTQYVVRVRCWNGYKWSQEGAVEVTTPQNEMLQTQTRLIQNPTKTPSSANQSFASFYFISLLFLVLF